ncbi:F-box/LRR-repeat protein 5-like [Rhincodon typus]|uniref:F-box/LRR-repeat protein 5-like n=1 Tax=Rhincodon typus TaxID=259920 RepID=UPI00202F100C|nr:F-box/LRR-repeat protein 5-like [Rhincodon typus]
MKMLQYLSKADNFYTKKILKAAFNKWMKWVQFQKMQQSLAVKHLQHVNDQLLCKIILQSWSTLAKETRKTREYFDRLERGELDDESDTQLTTPKNLKDIISTLPWSVNLKIFSYLGVKELVRSAQVCQVWKVIAQTSSLWSKLLLLLIFWRRLSHGGTGSNDIDKEGGRKVASLWSRA